MNRISRRFQELATCGKSAFIPFIAGGDPNLAVSEDIFIALEENGADIIEYGVPYSDPSGDGAVIQEASFRALQEGVTLHGILTSVERIRKRSQAPLLLFTYYNPVLAYGEAAFARDAANAGADGVLCVDLPPEEADAYRDALRSNSLTSVFLAAPTSTDARLALIGKACDTFVYYISRLGVTGERADLTHDLARAVSRVREKTGKPVAVGFGISTPEQAQAVARLAEGVVVGSALVRLIAQVQEKNSVALQAGAFAAELSRAIKGDLQDGWIGALSRETGYQRGNRGRGGNPT
ncbi:MAG: Tryptophan synthase alpha chain [Candidatus Hydrogenedentes bacterium ADurb.Bin101]|nr:MAG: Tryptophan synthase alpha chain [Candidatus Hydrogenedentes bacterium ADurb.Bin101]HOC69723.1 tryptophan synthase subunit alpha [Candidatus Hydrogenedentota bacterium]